jgi:hypothetical protein
LNELAPVKFFLSMHNKPSQFSLKFFIIIAINCIPFICAAQLGQHTVLANYPTVSSKKFGAVGDGKTNNTSAFQMAAKWLETNGGTLVIEPGVYIVGKQRFSGSYSSGGSYFDEPIIALTNATKPIVIIGKGATLKAANGLKYGSFNPVTGLKDSIRKLHNRVSYNASAFSFINAIGCISVMVKELQLDGNSSKMDIGPAFGPEGIQLSATGIRLYNNKHAVVENCYIHHCALDAVLIGWTGLKNEDPPYPHVIKNVKADFNGRQGISWVGGNSLQVYDCDFSNTGKSFNAGLPVVSKPSAGIDIEIEESIIKNGYFYNCTVFNNAGPGVSSIGHDTYNINFINCVFIGTTSSAAYPKSQCFSFDGCTFVGKVERIFGSKEKQKAISFKNCEFSMDVNKSPNKQVYGDRCEFYEGDNVLMESCIFDAAKMRLPVFSKKEITFLNCKFSQEHTQDFNAAAQFRGITHFNFKGTGKILLEEAIFEGEVWYNGKMDDKLSTKKRQ